MKLTNISLAILVALGLAACGGSDDNTPQTSDNQEAGHKNQTPTGGDETPVPPKDKSGLDPERVAPDLTVPKDLQTDVNVSKAAYLTRGFTDKALGYFNDAGRGYVGKKGTDPADIKFNSVYNFSDAGDFVDSRSTPSNSTYYKNNKTFSTNSEGAIYVGQDPKDGFKNNAFVKIGDKYYRVQADLPDTNAEYTPDTQFVLVRPVKTNGTAVTSLTDTEIGALSASNAADKSAFYIKKLQEAGYAMTKAGGGSTAGKKFKQSEVFFIANVDMSGWPKGVTQADVDKANAALAIELGEDKGFANNTGQTILQNVSFLGNEYNPEVTGQSLDFSKLPVNKDEIQFVDVSSKFNIRNDKNDGIDGNNFSVQRDIELGKVKAYNLPYSIAFVTVDPSKKNEKNIFDLPNATNVGHDELTDGSYQVRGYQTIALPKQGRAHYYGKSFNERVEGDIKLTADFFEDRAGVHGTVTNRKDVVKDKALPNLRLDLLTLTDPTKHGTFAQTGIDFNSGKGAVYGDPKVSGWSVQFYGLEAQEAGGKIYGTNYEEVYTTQRGRLTNLSNTSDVK